MQKRCAEQGGLRSGPAFRSLFVFCSNCSLRKRAAKYTEQQKAGFRPCAKTGLFDASVSAIGGLPGSGADSVCGSELAIEIGVVGKTAPEGCLLGGDTGAQQLLNVL